MLHALLLLASLGAADPLLDDLARQPDPKPALRALLSGDESGLRRFVAARLAPEARLRRAADHVLQQTPLNGHAVVPLLMEALESERGGILRKELLATLGRSRDRRAIPALVQLLDDPALGSKAAFALGNIGGPEAVAALEEAIRREPDWCGDLASALGLTKDLEALGRLALHPNPEARKEVVRALRFIGGPEALSLLHRMRKDPVKNIGEFADDQFKDLEARPGNSAYAPTFWDQHYKLRRLAQVLYGFLSAAAFGLGLLLALGSVKPFEPARAAGWAVAAAGYCLWASIRFAYSGEVEDGFVLPLVPLFPFLASLQQSRTGTRRLWPLLIAAPAFLWLAWNPYLHASAWAAAQPFYAETALVLAAGGAAVGLFGGGWAPSWLLGALFGWFAVPFTAVAVERGLAGDWDGAAIAGFCVLILLSRSLILPAHLGSLGPDLSLVAPGGLHAKRVRDGLILWLPQAPDWSRIWLILPGLGLIRLCYLGGSTSAGVVLLGGLGLVLFTLALFGVLGRTAVLIGSGGARRGRSLFGLALTPEKPLEDFSITNSDQALAAEQQRWIDQRLSQARR